MTLPCHIEFLGVTGSGKSTLVPTATTVIPEARNAKDAYIDSVTNSYISVILPLIFQMPGRIKRNIIRSYARLYNKPIYAYHDFLSKYPDFVTNIEQLMEKAKVDEKESVRRLLIRRAIRYGVLMHESTPIVFDEGFAMGAVSLFARRRESIDHQLLQQYMKAVPWPDIIIKINVDLEQCYQRAQTRPNGLPSTMKDFSMQKRQNRIADMAHYVTIVEDIAEQSDTIVVKVDNTETLSNTKQTLKRELSELY